MKMWLVRLGVAGFAALNILVIVYVWSPPPPAEMTLGRLAESGDEYRGRRVTVRNSVGGKPDGVWLVFDAIRADRHVVVMERKDPSEDGPVFEGWCYGIRRTPLAGCPVPPPFLYIAFAERSR